MVFNVVLLLLALGGFASSKSLRPRADVTSNITLYAYGGAINGAPVFYDDDLAFIGNNAPSDWTGSASNITFSTSSTSSGIWNISSSDNNITFNQTLSIYIVPTSGAFDQVGFASSTSNVPSGGTTAGFTWFGTAVAYESSDSEVLMQFWAVPTNTSLVWALYWNSNSTDFDGAFPIVLKSTAPTTTNA